MNRYRRFSILIVSVVFLSFAVLAASSHAGSRGISVKLKKSENPGASNAGEVRLYNSSHALVIGIDDYSNGWPRLSGAVNDARIVAKELENQGFDVTLEINLDSDRLKDVLNKFFIFKGENPEARLFVWFAGHGHTLNDEGYLVPADAPLPKEAAKFKYMALSLRRFGELVRQAQSKHAMAVFDSCFSGTIFSTQRSAPPAAITRATTLPVRQFLSSGDSDQEVSDDGRFRKLFVRALRGEESADANGDGYLTGSELGMFLTDRITNLTDSQQTPRYGKLRDENYDRGDFVFLLAGGDGRSGSEDDREADRRDEEEEVVRKPPVEKKPLQGTVRARLEPTDAEIRFLTIEKPFLQGMSLNPGDYQVEVSAEGYKTARTWFTVEAGEDKKIEVALERKSAPAPEPAPKPKPTPPPPPATVDITLQYQGDPYGCVLDLTVTVAGNTAIPTSNVLYMEDIPKGNVPWAVGGTIACGYMGTCAVFGQGTLNAYDGAVYNLMWQNTDMGQCIAWFAQ